jgi:intracellular sulfur oxidation DsrE/DsrF family protein
MSEQGPNRRHVLAAMAGASTALATAALVDTAAAQTPAPVPEPAHPDWNLGWVDEMAHKKHRTVFDATEIAGGTALANAFLLLRDYKSVYGTSDADMGVVIVVRHFAIGMVFGNASWAKFKLGEFGKVKDPATGEDALRNPFLRPKADEKSVLIDPDGGVDSLIARGVIFLCCNEALSHAAEMLGKQANIPGDEVRQSLIAALVPGTILVPSGIFGLARAEQAGCHYIRSS